MNSESESYHKAVKVGILGQEKVGKSYLIHKLTQKAEETAEETQHQNEGVHEKATSFIYVEHSSLSKQFIIEIGQVHRFDMLIFMFKDCESFTTLFEFFAQMKEVIDECKKSEVKFYWQHLKKIFLVYSDFEATKPIQIDQLFPILIEEIGNFCSTAAVKEYFIKKQLQNEAQLKALIEEEIVFADIPPAQKKQQTKENQNQQQEEERDFQKDDNAEQRKLGERQGELKQQQSYKEQQDGKNQEEGKHVQVHQEHISEDKKAELVQKRSHIYKAIHNSFFLSEAVEKQTEQEQGAPNDYVPVEKESEEKDEIKDIQQKDKKEEVKEEIKEENKNEDEDEEERQIAEEEKPADNHEVKIEEKKEKQGQKLQQSPQEKKKEEQKQIETSKQAKPLIQKKEIQVLHQQKPKQSKQIRKDGKVEQMKDIHPSQANEKQNSGVEKPKAIMDHSKKQIKQKKEAREDKGQQCKCQLY